MSNPGSFSFTPQPLPLSGTIRPVGVFSYDPGGSPKYALMTNIRVLGINWYEGPGPPSARLRYAFADVANDPADPQRIEEVYPLDASGFHVVETDDRIVIRAYNDDGSFDLLFEGYVQLPQADLAKEVETCSFEALGKPVREWDKPLGGALMRNADDPTNATKNDFQTDLPARFNPDGHPNRVATADASGTTDDPFCVFIGPIWPSNELGGAPPYEIFPWTIAQAAQYIIAQGNPKQTYTKYAKLAELANVLVAIEPTSDTSPIDLSDPTTYQEIGIDVPDLDITGMAWPDALQGLIEPHNFGMCWRLEPDENDDPEWWLAVYRKDDDVSVFSLQLQVPDDALDPGQSNVAGLSLTRDTADIANQVVIDSASNRIEASFVLAPMFAVDPADGADATAIAAFTEGTTSFTGGIVDKYRLFGFDECGEGHWDFVATAIDDTPGELKTVLKKDSFVIRRRPGLGKTITLQDDGKPFDAKLHLSVDYTGPEPGVWDGTGTWQEVTGDGWQLAPDRLGIRVTKDDPNNWNIGKSGTSGAPYPDGKVNLVEWIAVLASAAKRPRFRLTCVIEHDLGLGISAARRDASPTSFVREHRHDARSRFRKRTVSKWSSLASPAGPTGTTTDIEDDTDEAQAHADGLRRAHELGKFAGSVTIHRLTTAYQLSDKIDAILGRDISLRQNAASSAGEGDVLPSIVGITWDFDGKQSTTLQLSDRRAEPAPRRRGRDDD